MQSLETEYLERYKQSSTFRSYLASQRTTMIQKERPTECALCSVKTGLHAMHPLYDFHGPEGRQLVLPASGVGFRRKEKRLAWVHSLCAMFICSSKRTGSVMYGCDENGDWEDNGSDDDEDAKQDCWDSEKKHGKVIVDSDDDEDDKPSSSIRSSAEEEQRMFTKCEVVFRPLMKRSREAFENDGSQDVDAVMECIDSMMEHVELLTPSFIRVYQIGALLKQVKKAFESTHPEVRARCKRLSAEMKRVFNEKEKMVPEGFEPVKDLKSPDVEEEDGSNPQSAAAKIAEQKYKIGTSVMKEFEDKTYNGKITSYTDGLYHVAYEDGDAEDLTESEVSHLLLSYTAWFCMAAQDHGTDAGATLKSLRGLTCVICKKKDNASKKCLRIPVQCSAGDPYEFKQFRKYHKSLNKKQKVLAKLRMGGGGAEFEGCTDAMHVGCARWGSDYAMVKNKNLRMCYYFSGKPPTYDGPDEYCDPVSNCFCRLHAREIQVGLGTEVSEGGGAAAVCRKRKSDDAHADDDATNHVSNESNDSEDAAEKARRMRIAIAKKKKQRRIMEESDEESD